MSARGGLVERDAEGAIAKVAQVDAGGLSQRRTSLASFFGADADGVEEDGVQDGARAFEARFEHAAEGVGAGGDAAEALWAVVDGVHARHHRQQHLRGADVAGRLLAADVLLAGLDRHAVGGVTTGRPWTRR